MPRLPSTVSAFVLFLLACSLPAKAQTLSLACELETTADGFVALRAGPSPKAALVLKMRPDSLIYLVIKGDMREERGGWLRVAHIAKSGGGENKTIGWMWGKLLAGCDA